MKQLNPFPSSPTRFSSGTQTSLKLISEVGDIDFGRTPLRIKFKPRFIEIQIFSLIFLQNLAFYK